MPLLIGGATTSRVHTAVKIHPNYRAARRSMSMTPAAPSASSQSLLVADNERAYIETIRAEYRKVADAHARAELESSACRSPRRAATRCKLDWAAYAAAQAQLYRNARLPHL